MNNTSQLALNLQESDYSTFSLGIFSTCLLSLFCLCCLKIRPKKTGKKDSRYTYFPRFVTSFLCWVLRFKNIFSIIFQNLNIDCYEINSDSYLSLPCEKDVIGWHRDAAFQLEPENVKIKSRYYNIKIFIYLNPNPFSFKQKIKLLFTDKTGV